MSAFPTRFTAVAEQNGWTTRRPGYFGWWTLEFIRGDERLKLRLLNGKLTAAAHYDGSGVILEIKKDKRQQVYNILSAERAA